MQLQDQVTSLELAKQLKEAGVPQESLFCYREQGRPVDLEDGSRTFTGTGKYRMFYGEGMSIDVSKDKISAFTVAELGELLKKDIEIQIDFTGDGYRVWYFGRQLECDKTWEENLAEALGQMLLHLIKQGIIKFI